MKISKVYVNTHRYDLELTRSCIASIRYWYPDIPIYLIIDYSNGPWPAHRMIKRWNLSILDTGKQQYGWGFGKFEPLFLPNSEHFLVLDADTVITGPVLDKVRQIEADFVVDEEVQPLEKFKALYYDPVQVKAMFPEFEYPGYSFNTGQWIGKGNIIKKDDFNSFVSWRPSPKLKHPQCFKQADQGLFNMLIHLKEKEKKISVAKLHLMIWPENGSADFILFSSIGERKSDAPFVIHWAGMKFSKLNQFPRADILQFYQNFYYSKFTMWEKVFDKLVDMYLKIERKVRFRLTRLRNQLS